MNQQQECRTCDYRRECESAHEDTVAIPGCNAYTEPGTSAIDRLVKAARGIAAATHPTTRCPIPVQLCDPLAQLILALIPFQEDHTDGNNV